MPDRPTDPLLASCRPTDLTDPRPAAFRPTFQPTDPPPSFHPADLLPVAGLILLSYLATALLALAVAWH